MQTIANISDIVVGVLTLGITLIGIIPSWRERLFRWFPRISVHYEEPKRGEQNSFKQLRPLTGKPHTGGWFFRLGIANGGYSPLSDADVQIVRIERFFNGRRYPYVAFSPMELHWANAQGSASRTIFADDGIADYVDVVHSIEGLDKLLLFVKEKHMNSGNNLALPKGQYYLHLRVVGKSNLPLRPTKQIVFVDWNGVHGETHFELLDEASLHKPAEREYSNGTHWVEAAGFVEVKVD